MDSEDPLTDLFGPAAGAALRGAAAVAVAFVDAPNAFPL